MKAQIGMVGLAVMGKNLTLNIRDHGFKVAVYEYMHAQPFRTSDHSYKHNFRHTMKKVKHF